MVVMTQPASPGRGSDALPRSDYFYPLPQTSETTTLREATLGVTCWFTFAFTETFAATERSWVSFRASDSIWVYFDGTLLTSHQGSFYFCCLSHRVGINAEERIDLSQHVAALSRPYYSLHVFAASRSCVTNSSLFSAFHWTTSTPAMPALEDHLNHHVTMTPDNTDSVDVTWAGGTATLQANSFVRLQQPPAPFYRLEAELQIRSFSPESFLCLVVHGVRAMRPSVLRAGVDVGSLSTAPCEMSGATVAVMLTASSERGRGV